VVQAHSEPTTSHLVPEFFEEIHHKRSTAEDSVFGWQEEGQGQKVKEERREEIVDGSSTGID